MPIHDWSRVPSGLFHDFHQSWSIRIKDALNAGRLPKGVAAFVEQRAGVREGDVLSIEHHSRPNPENTGGAVTADKPKARIMRQTDRTFFSRRANRVVVRHHLGRIVAVIEIVSPGNKDSRSALRDFVEKTAEFLTAGIHALIVDLFPPGARDPFGIHKAIWDEFHDEPFEFPAGKDLILASYVAAQHWAAYVEPVAVGDVMPDMPLFLAEDLHVPVPLESTYCATWEATPEAMRVAVQTGVLPDPDAD